MTRMSGEDGVFMSSHTDARVISYGNWRPVVQGRLADSDADAQVGQQHRPVAALPRVR